MDVPTWFPAIRASQKLQDTLLHSCGPEAQNPSGSECRARQAVPTLCLQDQDTELPGGLHGGHGALAKWLEEHPGPRHLHSPPSLCGHRP